MYELKTKRRHFYLVLSSPLSHTKKTKNREMAFVCVLIGTQAKVLKTWYARSNVSLGEGNNMQWEIINSKKTAGALSFFKQEIRTRNMIVFFFLLGLNAFNARKLNAIETCKISIRKDLNNI